MGSISGVCVVFNGLNNRRTRFEYEPCRGYLDSVTMARSPECLVSVRLRSGSAPAVFRLVGSSCGSFEVLPRGRGVAVLGGCCGARARRAKGVRVP